jgi:protein gp37
MGCTNVSPGCDHCYAETMMDKRYGKVQWGPGKPRVRTAPATWRKPLLWEREHEAFMLAHGRRRRVFCASLADVFDNEVAPQWRADLFKLIEATPHLDWLLLTKRIGNAHEMMFAARGGHLPLLSNVWLGATVVDQAEVVRDIPKLLRVPARVRFLSVEPMLGPVDLTGVKLPMLGKSFETVNVLQRKDSLQRGAARVTIDWVICGGESGPGARPLHPEWVRSLRDQCAAAGVPFHFKQWGEWLPGLQDGKPTTGVMVINAGDKPMRVGTARAGRSLDGRTHDEFPHHHTTEASPPPCTNP